MSGDQHLIIPYADAAGLEAARAAVAGELRVLQGLLARLQPGEALTGDAQDLSPPHERAQARALGLPAADGAIAWAAWERTQSGQAPDDAAWAWISPCHWHVAQDHILMHPVDDLQLTEEDAQALLAAVSPYFREDGIALDFLTPTRWIARGDVFRGLACASLDRVCGRRVDDWLPRSAAARPLRRLQQEMQMLLYTHPVNEAREQAGLRPVNSFWVSGAGALAAAPAMHAPVRVDDRLRAPALAGHAGPWADGWRALDTQVLPALLESAQRGHPVTLTLCGERHARTWTTASSPPAWWHRAARLLRPPQVATVLETL
ncbi:MAG: hypothetical protein RIS88_1526 [Pseudomonadota bacterium]|jgi:hypothetical protein